MSGWSGEPSAAPRWAGPLSAHVARLCAGLCRRVGHRAATELREIERGLDGPVRVAVAGRVSSGKSTLVNALIGRRVAPTGAGECTRLVTRFRSGTVERVEVVFRDHRREVLPFGVDGAAGTVPERPVADPAQVAHLDAYLSSAVLRDLVVVDTPGVGASTDPGPAGSAAPARAEAVLSVVTQAVRADDAQLLAAFTAATGPGAAGPVNTIAVLNKVDTVPPESVPGSGGDVDTAAALLAARQAAVLGHRVAAVVPMIGLLAETAETGSFTAGDADALRALTAVEPATLDAMLLDAELFTTFDVPVPAAARQRLLRLLDLHGVARMLAALRADPALEAGALRNLIARASGLDVLRERLATVLRARADEIKAAGALRAVTALAAGCGAGERAVIDAEVETALAHPRAHQLRLLDAVSRVSRGAVPLAAELVEEIVRLGGPGPVGEQFGLPGRPAAELAAHALRRAGWWRSFATVGSTPAQSRIAHVVHRAYFLRWQWLRGGCPGG